MLLMSLSFSDVWTTIVGVLYTIFLMINSFIYDLINFTYQIFLALASAQIFTADQYQTMAQKVYVVIGVVALFFVAYALLRAIADPEGSSKGDMAVGKVVPNLLKAIILIAFTPTIFNIAYNLQNVIIKNNVIPALVVGNSFSSSNVSTINGGTFDLKSAGNNLANDTFTQFLTTASGSDKGDIKIDGECKIGTCLNKDDNSEISYNDMFLSVQDESKGYIVYANLGEAAAKGDLDYNFLMQFAVGLFMVYVFVSFCIDMAVRIFKLAYYQIIAPIPILTLIIPGQKKIFDNWKNGSIATFAEVFIRLAIVMFGMVLIQSLPDFTSDFWSNAMINPSPAVSNFAKIFIIIGVLMFIKQAPKLISDMFGIKSGSFNLGIGKKLGEMAFVGGAATNAMNTGKGYVTGGLGGAFQGLRTGGIKGLKAGALLGAANGSKAGGNQFGKQRDAFVQRYFNDSSAKASLFNSVDKDGNKKAGVAGGFAARNKNAFNDYLKNNQNKNFAAAEAKNQSDLELNTNSANSRYESSVVSANARATSEKEAAKTLFDNNMSRLTQKYNEDRATAQTIFDQANASYKSGAKSYLTSEKEKQWQQYARNNNISTNDLSRYSSEHEAFNNNKELDNKIMDNFIAKSPEAAEYRTALQNLNSIDNKFKLDSQTIKASYDSKISNISSANEQAISNATEARDTAINAAQNTFDTTAATISESKLNTIEGRLQTSGDQFSAQAAENKKLSKALEEFMKNNMSDTVKPPSSDSGDKPIDKKQ